MITAGALILECVWGPRDAGKSNFAGEFAKSPHLTGAGEGIRTLDPDLGKVVLYP